MKEILSYVLVEGGFEGFEEIIWATPDRELVVRMFSEIKDFLHQHSERLQERYESMRSQDPSLPEDFDFYKDAYRLSQEVIRELLSSDPQRWELFPLYRGLADRARFVRAENLCVQRFDPELGSFRCYCQDLGLDGSD